MQEAIVKDFMPAGRRYQRSALTTPNGREFTILYHDIEIPYYGIGARMAMLYGALAMFPLGWATAGYVLVSRAPLASAQKGMPR
jgi:hypothetical protein